MIFQSEKKRLLIHLIYILIILLLLIIRLVPPSSDGGAFASSFNNKLRWQIETQWRWANVYRFLDITLTLIAWISGLALLGLSGFQLHMKEEIGSKIKIWIPICSALAVSFPALINTIDFGRQQNIYESAAREYDELYNKLVFTKNIDIDKAVESYNEIHKRIQYLLINKEGLFTTKEDSVSKLK